LALAFKKVERHCDAPKKERAQVKVHFGLGGVHYRNISKHNLRITWALPPFIGLAYYQGKKDIVLRFILEYSSLRDFYRPLGNIRSIFI
jgi:hypothetical protein